MKNYLKRVIKAVLNEPIVERISEPVLYTAAKDYQIVVSEKRRFEGKVALVTGASGWLGCAISKRLAAEGAVVFLGGRNTEKLEALRNEIGELKGTAVPLPLDVTNNESIERAVNSIIQTHGRIDILVNCAGGSTRGKAKNLYEQDVGLVDEMLTLNLRGSMLCTRAAGKYMVQQGSGRIINISSVIGEHGKPKFSDYAAAKAGIIGYTKSCAQEFGAHGVTVNVVSPGFIQRGSFDNRQLEYLLKSNYLNQVGTAEDVAAAVAFIASEEAGFITGQNLCVDGGRSLGLHGD